MQHCNSLAYVCPYSGEVPKWLAFEFLRGSLCSKALVLPGIVALAAFLEWPRLSMNACRCMRS